MKKKLFIVKLNWVDCVTLLGVISSFYAFIMAFLSNGRPEFFSFSLCLLFVAMTSDAMDGFLARRFKLERPFGRYLDGFIDVLIYLVGPALFVYAWGMTQWYYILIMCLFIGSGVVRLSVFNEIGNIKKEDNSDPNENGKKKLGYLGMPVFWSLFILSFFYILSWWVKKEIIFPLTAVVFLIFSFYMVYNASFFKFKSWKVLLFICIAFALFFGIHGMCVNKILCR